MKKLLIEFAKTFHLDKNHLVDSEQRYHDILINELPKTVQSIVGDSYLVKSSVGQGRKTRCPWLAIYDKRVTTSATKGIYVVFLFKSDLSGFYLTIGQGITNYEKRFHKNKYIYADIVSQYFKDTYTGTSFAYGDISLGANKGDLGYGYEKANILSKYYDFRKIDQWNIESDLLEITKIYNDIVEDFLPKTYETVIDLILEKEFDFLLDEDEADILMTKALIESSDQNEIKLTTLHEVHPEKKKINVNKKEVTRKINKTDYLAKAKTDANTGLLGEKLVLEFEKDRVKKLGLDDLVNKIKWVAQESDSYGYDLESFDIIDEKIVKRYIEVKTSKLSEDGMFYVSRNELETSKRLDKNYWIYRVYDVASEDPKVYCINGPITDNFVLETSSFIAIYNKV